jgi:hypothetical protein
MVRFARDPAVRAVRLPPVPARFQQPSSRPPPPVQQRRRLGGAAKPRSVALPALQIARAG